MANPNQLPTPATEASESIQLELLALSLLTGRPEGLEIKLLSLGGAVVIEYLEEVQYVPDA